MNETTVPHIQVFGSDEDMQTLFDFAYACEVITDESYWILLTAGGVKYVGLRSHIRNLFVPAIGDKVLVPVSYDKAPPKMYLLIESEKDMPK